MLILLTHANHLYADPKQVQKMQPYPPLQTLTAAALLRREGHDVRFFDTTFNRDFTPALDARPELVAVIEDNFNFLTKMCLLTNRELAFEIAAAARERGIPAIVNSSDASGNPALYADAGFTRVIAGELEDALLKCIAAWPHTPEPTARVTDLDALPMPAWDLLDIAPYRQAWTETHGYFSLNLTASRGCPYHCNWCARPIHGDAYRAYSPARAAAELERAYNFFTPDHVWFADDIFALSPRWAREFAAHVQRLGLRTPFKMQSRCDLMTRDTVSALADAGCTEVWMGAESGSQRILDAMDKGIRVEQIAAACENLRRHRIRACLFLQFGYVGEEWEDIEATIRMVRSVRPDDIGISVSYPLPGTRFFQIVTQHTANWRDSGDLKMTYAGAFPTEFYRLLAGALHDEVRGRNAEQAWDKLEAMRCACC